MYWKIETVITRYCGCPQASVYKGTVATALGAEAPKPSKQVTLRSGDTWRVKLLTPVPLTRILFMEKIKDGTGEDLPWSVSYNYSKNGIQVEAAEMETVWVELIENLLKEFIQQEDEQGANWLWCLCNTHSEFTVASVEMSWLSGHFFCDPQINNIFKNPFNLLKWAHNPCPLQCSRAPFPVCPLIHWVLLTGKTAQTTATTANAHAFTSWKPWEEGQQLLRKIGMVQWVYYCFAEYSDVPEALTSPKRTFWCWYKAIIFKKDTLKFSGSLTSPY